MSRSEKDLLFSLTKKDFEWDYFSGTGAGGQHRNRHKNCVRVKHVASGATGQCQDFREKKRNETIAFERMAKSAKIQDWLRREAARVTGELAEVEARVDKMMSPANIKVEGKKEGKWVDLKK